MLCCRLVLLHEGSEEAPRQEDLDRHLLLMYNNTRETFFFLPLKWDMAFLSSPMWIRGREGRGRVQGGDGRDVPIIGLICIVWNSKMSNSANLARGLQKGIRPTFFLLFNRYDQVLQFKSFFKLFMLPYNRNFIFIFLYPKFLNFHHFNCVRSVFRRDYVQVSLDTAHQHLAYKRQTNEHLIMLFTSRTVEYNIIRPHHIKPPVSDATSHFYKKIKWSI